MSEHHEDIESPFQEPLGSILERTRRSRHATLEEAAEATRISPRVLAALEADDYHNLSAEVFTRGFIKLYAKYLGLDPDETLAHYINQENVDPDKPAERPYRREVLNGEAMAHAPSFFKGSRKALVIILLLALLVGLYLLGRIYKPGNYQAEDNLAGDRPSAIVGSQYKPAAEMTPPSAESGQTEHPAERGVKVIEPEITVQKDQGGVASSPHSATNLARLNGKPANKQENLPEERSQAPPAKPQPSASLIKGSASAPATTAHFSEASVTATKPRPESKPEHFRAAIAASAQPAEVVSPNPQPFQPVTVQVAGNAVDGADDLSPSTDPPTGPHNYVLEGRFRDSSWVHIEVDDQPVREYTSQADVTRVWRAADHLVLELGNGGAVDLTLNGKPFPVAAKPGEAAIIRIPTATP